MGRARIQKRTAYSEYEEGVELGRASAMLEGGFVQFTAALSPVADTTETLFWLKPIKPVYYTVRKASTGASR